MGTINALILTSASVALFLSVSLWSVRLMEMPKKMGMTILVSLYASHVLMALAFNAGIYTYIALLTPLLFFMVLGPDGRPLLFKGRLERYTLTMTSAMIILAFALCVYSAVMAIGEVSVVTNRMALMAMEPYMRVVYLWSGALGSVFSILTAMAVIMAVATALRAHVPWPYYPFISALLTALMAARFFEPPEAFYIGGGFEGINPVLYSEWNLVHPWPVFLGYGIILMAMAWAIEERLNSGIKAHDMEGYIPGALFAASGAITVGTVMGALWAYHTNTFGGYWFWDPIESASLGIVAVTMATALVIRSRIGRGWPLGMAPAIYSSIAVGVARMGLGGSIHAYASIPSAQGEGLALLFMALTLACLYPVFSGVNIVLKRGHLGTGLVSLTLLLTALYSLFVALWPPDPRSAFMGLVLMLTPMLIAAMYILIVKGARGRGYALWLITATVAVFALCYYLLLQPINALACAILFTSSIYVLWRQARLWYVGIFAALIPLFVLVTETPVVLTIVLASAIATFALAMPLKKSLREIIRPDGMSFISFGAFCAALLIFAHTYTLMPPRKNVELISTLEVGGDTEFLGHNIIVRNVTGGYMGHIIVLSVDGRAYEVHVMDAGGKLVSGVVNTGPLNGMLRIRAHSLSYTNGTWLVVLSIAEDQGSGVMSLALAATLSWAVMHVFIVPGSHPHPRDVR